MLLCLDVGNTHILGGVFNEKKLISRFRYATNLMGTADQFGMFLLNILRTNQIELSAIKATAVSSVVPGCDFTIHHAISLYLKCDYYELQWGVKTGLNITCENPAEVGADRIANAIGAVHAFPNQNMIIVDMGTATTLCVVTKKREYLGGSILPGMRLGMESLKANTAKLMAVEIEAPASAMGRNTKESIQSGLYFGQLGALKELIHSIKQEIFPDESVKVIGTGGFAQLYREKKIFDAMMPDLVLQGLCKAYELSL